MTGNGISLVTLGVADLARSSLYYQALGWQPSSDGNEQVVFLKGRNLVLGLYGRSALAEDAQVEDRPTGFAAITLACNCASRDEVDRLFSAAMAAGGQATKMPQEVFWGATPDMSPTRMDTFGKLPTTRSGRSTSRATWSCPEVLRMEKRPAWRGAFLGGGQPSSG